ncbi:MAG: iron ABC transporter permease, partial [Boseongicola sp. SB0662_bin_57]|nr:iron ABC transporter permease [Boseongicola sp. SB0662_bin_57]
MSAKALLPLLFCFMPSLAIAQGFAQLGQTSEGYALPDPTTRFTFPDDHGSHPEFRIEWWYVTANLKDAEGTDYGIQWTLFRNALSPSGKPDEQAWMGHAAVSTPADHLFAERLARGGIGQAGVT